MITKQDLQNLWEEIQSARLLLIDRADKIDSDLMGIPIKQAYISFANYLSTIQDDINDIQEKI